MKGGDERAVRDFCQRFGSRVARMARRSGVPDRDCDDVVQEVLTNAVHQIRDARFRSDSSVAACLDRVIDSGIVNYFRRAPAGVAVPLDVIGQAPAPSPAYSPDDVLWLRQALSRLSAAEQLLIRFHDWEQLTLEEIGRRVGLKKYAVAGRLQRARRNLRLALRTGRTSTASKRLKN